jgi:hypothetical protein
LYFGHLSSFSACRVFVAFSDFFEFLYNIVTPKEEEPHSGMKKFWTYIKHKRKDNIGISSLMMDGKLFCDPASKSNNHENKTKHTKTTK